MCVYVWLTDKVQGNSSTHRRTYTVVAFIFHVVCFPEKRFSCFAKLADGALESGH